MLTANHLFFSFIVLSGALLASVSAADLKTKDLEQMVTDLNNLRKAIVSQHSKQNAVALKAFQKHVASSASANQFYLECLKKLRFTDEGKKAEAWRVYRDNKDDEFSQVFHREAKQMELRYIIMMIQAVRAKDRRDLMPTLLAHIDKLLEMDGRAYEFMDSADGSLFTEVYDIRNTVNPGEWSMDPANISGIYDTAILPHMRQHKDPRLVTAWKSKIEHMKAFAEKKKEAKERDEREAAREARKSSGGRNRNDPSRRAEASAEVDRYKEFQVKTLPALKWGMCQDLFEHGFESDALPLMFKVIRDHPENEEVMSWLSELDTGIKEAIADFGSKALAE